MGIIRTQFYKHIHCFIKIDLLSFMPIINPCLLSINVLIHLCFLYWNMYCHRLNAHGNQSIDCSTH